MGFCLNLFVGSGECWETALNRDPLELRFGRLQSFWLNFGGGVELKLNSDLPFLGCLMEGENDKKQQQITKNLLKDARAYAIVYNNLLE